ncbi:hypothetical protein U1Q18_042265 [Sarracenia purpurea var. burkii]
MFTYYVLVISRGGRIGVVLEALSGQPLWAAMIVCSDRALDITNGVLALCYAGDSLLGLSNNLCKGSLLLSQAKPLEKMASLLT